MRIAFDIKRPASSPGSRTTLPLDLTRLAVVSGRINGVHQRVAVARCPRVELKGKVNRLVEVENSLNGSRPDHDLLAIEEPVVVESLRQNITISS